MSKYKILKFSAGWCAPCRTLSPLLKEVCAKLNLQIDEYDADKDEQVFAKYAVKSVPTIIVVKEDIEVARHVGLLPRTKLMEFITENKK